VSAREVEREAAVVVERGWWGGLFLDNAISQVRGRIAERAMYDAGWLVMAEGRAWEAEQARRRRGAA
jgi:hypothetical protein